VIQYIDKPKRLSLMEYLYYAGDDRFGALGVSTSSTAYQPSRNGPLPRLQDAQTLSEVVAKVNAKEPINALERQMLAAGGSFGGAKPKALIEIDGEQWVIKFFNGEPIDVPLIEHASMTLAKQAGITTAETQVVHLLGENALVVKRFDRGFEASQRIHCLSAGTALLAEAVEGQSPDFGYPQLAQLLRRVGVTQNGANQQDMQELFRRMVFNILIDNTDDHEKNHALLVTEPLRQGRLRLAPAFDVLPTNSGQGHQEFIVGLEGQDSTLANAMSQCALFGLTKPAATAEVRRVIAVVDGWQAHFKACGVSNSDLASLAERIDGRELLAMRQSF
jgi:serine/threonine-protein kinase HipA